MQQKKEYERKSSSSKNQQGDAESSKSNSKIFVFNDSYLLRISIHAAGSKHTQHVCPWLYIPLKLSPPKKTSQVGSGRFIFLRGTQLGHGLCSNHLDVLKYSHVEACVVLKQGWMSSFQRPLRNGFHSLSFANFPKKHNTLGCTSWICLRNPKKIKNNP